MLRTSAAVRAAAMAASGVVHAAAFTLVGGHASANGTESVDRTVEVSLEPPDDVSPAAKSALIGPADDRHAAAAHPHTHTHPYPVPPSHDWTPHDPALVHVYAPAAPYAPAEATTETVPAGEAPPRFTIVMGGTRSTGGGAIAGAPGDAPPGGAEPIPAERATTPARLLLGASPRYPPDARADGAEADVLLEIVVDPAGRVSRARVVHAASPSFDEAALAAVAAYRFAPATLDGKAVSVRMRWSVEFRLQ